MVCGEALTVSIQKYRFFALNGNRCAPVSYALELGRSCDAERAGQAAGKGGVMLVPPPGQLSIVLKAWRVDLEVTRQYQNRTMRLIARLSPAVDRM